MIHPDREGRGRARDPQARLDEAAGLAVVTLLAGPARVMRLVRGSVVPALLVRQLFSRRR